MRLFGYEHHKNRSPWEGAPSWAIELGLMLSTLIENTENNTMSLNDLQEAVAAENTVIDSAIVLIQGIPALIAAAGTDATKLAELQNEIIGKTASLAAAVANIPASATAPAPAPVPPPETPPPAPESAPTTPQGAPSAA